MMRRWAVWVSAMALVVTGLGGAAGCSDDDDDTHDAGVDARVRPDAYVGDCQDDPVPVFGGSHQVLINDLQIARPTEGFDLDYDGDIDNLLGLLGSVANAELSGSVEAGDIFIPFEFFGLDNPISDDCLNIALYISGFPPDQDDDGERTGGAVGRDQADCNDWDPAIHPGATEDGSDFVDNNCDGRADETGDATPSTNTVDRDGDGYSPAQGDCDDRLPSDWPTAPAHWDPTLINPGEAEICGDGFDNNCNGIADEDCNPLTDEDGSLETLPVDASSLEPSGDQAIIVFRSGRVDQGILYAGPSRFEVKVPIEGRDLELRLTFASLTAEVTEDSNGGLYLAEGLLGGVLSGKSLDNVPNIAPDLLGGDDDSTLLDIIVGPFGMLVALPTIGVCVPKGGGGTCRSPSCTAIATTTAATRPSTAATRTCGCPTSTWTETASRSS